jgi:DNA (cytosine-5)-methyltransferase 1
MITVTTLFAGAGGDAQGAESVPDVRVQLAANHSTIAMRSHAANFPHAEHDVADLSQVEPRRYRRTSILWGSPECTKQSIARGRRRDDHHQPSLLAQDQVTDELAERSRATMFDVHRFTEHHRYDLIVVENVVEAADWSMWRSWRLGFDDLGYDHRVLCLNSMHFPGPGAGRAPQSRDRLYVVAWRRGAPAPDLDFRPRAWCPPCAQEVGAVQSWKRPGNTIGRYRAQYVFRCPNRECRHAIVEPFALGAEQAIDWTIPSERIGSRRRPFVPATMRRISIGLERYARQPIVVPYYGTGVAHPVTEPLRTVPTKDRFRLAFIAEQRGGGSTARSVTQPLATVATSGNHHRLVEPPALQPRIEDCLTRMLTAGELQAAMGFRPGYVVLGNDEQRKLQIGNAVTPCAAEFLIGAGAASLGRAG